MMAQELISHARGRALIADTGYDADRIVDAVRAKGMTPVIHCNPTRKRKRRLNRKLYGIRYHVERFIHRIKRLPRCGNTLREERGFLVARHHSAEALDAVDESPRWYLMR